MIETLKKYDAVYLQNRSHGDETSEDVFCFTDFGTNLILSAPHATASFANKKEKQADLFTGALVQYLGMKNHISNIIRKKFTPYKCLISDYISEHGLCDHYFLDIHGFVKIDDCDVCLGTGLFGATDYPYVKEILDIAQKYNLRVALNHPDYRGKAGLVGRLQQETEKPCCLQVELHRNLRDFYQYPDTVKNVTIPFLEDIIKCSQ